jgi:bacterioferritin
VELKLPVSDAAPYPALRIQGPSPVCVQAMLENIGSCHSEMTAIALYLYDSVLTRERWPKIAEYFHHIMIVEMRHLELFCQAAQLLGADPRLWSNAGGASYWNASCCSYRKDLPALLNAAAAGESQTIAQYRRQAEQLPDPNICELLKRILLDEEKHLVIFRRLYQEYCGPGRQN